MGIFRSMAGMLSVEIISADIAALLAAMAEQKIQIFHARTKGELTVELLIRRRDWKSLAFLCKRRGDVAKVRHRLGFYWRLKGLLHRPLLLGGMAVLVVLTLFLPTRVLFTRVEGNVTIPTARILEAAADSGIYFGVSRREVRSERTKNALLDAVPQLQWAGVNTYGCVAVISVRERAPESQPGENNGISSIVAACDGIVLSATATQGSCLCRPGQSVTKGQVLISGYTDLGIAIRGEQAEGEIFAQTRHEIRAVTPLQVTVSRDEEAEIVKYSLRLGKNRINLWKGSGIWEGSCDRMYEEYYITLPGGFQLPIALIKETARKADTQTICLEPEILRHRLEQFGEGYLLSQMISGRITGEEITISEENGLLVLEGEYFCTEMIGRLRQEKFGE